MEHMRLDDRKVLIAAVRELLRRGYPLDEADVILSICAPVDLDLLQQCIEEVLETAFQPAMRDQESPYLAAA